MNEHLVPSDDHPRLDALRHIAGDSSTSQAAQREDFEVLWLQRKLLVEAAAEAKARHLFRQRQKDQVSLEASIDSSLREYGEMHEQAHALRLQFEDEKHRWMAAVLENARTAENTPGKRQRVPQSSPYSYYRDHTQQPHPSRAATDSSSYVDCAPSESSPCCEDLQVQFQYEVDQYDTDRYEPQLPAPVDPHRPPGKRQKRFLVPIKVRHE